MACYQVAIVPRPEGWKPQSPDDVPPNLGAVREILAEEGELFVAVQKAVRYNERATADSGNGWAIVIEPGTYGRSLPGARLCSPIAYKVMSIWWPQGWEPASPLDVPNCLWQSQGEAGDASLTYERAKATIRSLNRQCMDHPGSTWYLIVAIENESLSRSISYDPSGSETTVEVRRLHVIRPEEGGRGDCSYCPAHSFACAQENWASRAQTVTTQGTRSSNAHVT